MDQRIHVNHVVLTLAPGGLEQVVLNLVREGLRLGQRVSVVCLEDPGILAPQVEALGVPVCSVYKPAGLHLGPLPGLRSWLAANRPDVVHTHQMGALFYAGPLARRAGVGAVLHTEHGKHYETRRRARWLAWWAARHAARFCCVSADIAASIIQWRIAPADKVAIVPNGIATAAFAGDTNAADLRHRLGIPPEAPVIGTVGRLVEVKRQDLLLRALALLEPCQGHLPHALLVGEGVCLADLWRLAVSLGISERVHFAGYQAHPQPYYGLMDIFALTSRTEGMPLAVLEAWAAGRPVVASRVGGLPELIADGQTGLLFDPPDVAALAGHLRALLTDPHRAQRLGLAGQVLVRQRFDVATMAQSYQRHYRQLLGHDAPACSATPAPVGT